MQSQRLVLTMLVCAMLAGAAYAIPAGSDFQPPVGRDAGSPPESPGHFRLLTAYSRDGLTFTPTGTVITDQGNVPDLVVDGNGRISLYYTAGRVGNRDNTTVVALSSDGGRSWQFRFLDLPGRLQHAGDPDVVLLPDGTFRLFLTTQVGANIGVICLESRDGIHFEPRGTAFAKAGTNLMDSTTFKVGGTWHMLTLEEHGMTQRHGTSSDGRTFTIGEQMPFDIDGEQYIGANPVPLDNGAVRMYAFSIRRNDFRSLTSTDGVHWKVEPGVRLSLTGKTAPGSRQIKDPAVVRLPDGTWLMVYTARIP